MRYLKYAAALVLILQLVPRLAIADTAWVRFKSGTEPLAALIALPTGTGPHPAVVYSHGMIVRVRGFEAASAQGYDTAGYVEALADAGYVALAPIRAHLATADLRAAVSDGAETVKAAIGYLKARSDVDATRVGAVGFSEGGLVTLWSAISGAELDAMVLMSPGAMLGAGDRNLEAATSKTRLQHLSMPVMLTLGTDDPISIRDVTARRLIPTMEELGKTFTSKTDYPGDHRWFWRVRPSHFGDLTAFLAEHLN